MSYDITSVSRTIINGGTHTKFVDCFNHGDTFYKDITLQLYTIDVFSNEKAESKCRLIEFDALRSNMKL